MYEGFLSSKKGRGGGGGEEKDHPLFFLPTNSMHEASLLTTLTHTTHNAINVDAPTTSVAPLFTILNTNMYNPRFPDLL